MPADLNNLDTIELSAFIKDITESEVLIVLRVADNPTEIDIM